MRGVLSKLTTWVLLVACLLTGLAPATELVLCFEPDGTVVLEAADVACCQGSSSEEARAPADRDAGCPCIDIRLVRSNAEPQARPRPCAPRPRWVDALPPTAPALVFAAAEPAASVSPRAAPRPAPGLAAIRTVVLRV